MPRQLPWKVDRHATATGPKPKKTPSWSHSTASPAPSGRSTPRPKIETESAESGRKTKLGRIRSGRSPSTSPPPEPLEEELMHPGLAHDDRFRMVEDEFLFIAGIFTRHLHAAEYQRLKNLAAARSSQSQHPGTDIPRPVTGEMTELVRRRNAALDTANRQRKGIERSLARANGDDRARVPPVRQSSSLQGLMESPRRQKVPLAGLVGGSRPGSRAGLGLGSRPGSGYRGGNDGSPGRRRPGSGYGYGCGGRGVKREVEMEMEVVTESEEDEDGDLDGQPWSRRPELSRPRHAENPPIRRTTDPATKRPEKELENPFKRVKTAPLPALARESPVKTEVVVHRDENHGEHQDEDEDEDFFTRLRARRAEQKRRREAKVTDRESTKTTNAQAASLNSIPFM